ncbi:purine-binding chemotaxis protein CheW [Dyella choica]|uniref:Purine-binding chemotaxis protein CheW n=2 Tax=Dyella choica TaxID=1927959 RepID=A0A3S0RN20_9GAMM|nr:purine-binding chemotaxis protein CheW [Dyella choica]
MQGEKAKLGRNSSVRFDYVALERKLATAHASIESSWTLTPEDSRRILAARAQALAMGGTPEEASESSIEVVEFNLAYERYAIESHYVREVHPLENLTPVPCTPSHVLGVANLRGEIISVIDIRIFFDLPKRGLPDLNKVIVLESEHMSFGVLVDAVARADKIRVADIQPALPAMTGIRETYLMGLTADCLAILDGGKLLSDAGIVVNEQIRES